MILYRAVVLLGAFLLFLVQPVAARRLLPDYGGSASVWATCLVFYQGGLLAGYLYAHGVARWLSARLQAAVHATLVLAALAVLPVTLEGSAEPGVDAAAAILRRLAAALGPPYLLLAATAPLVQAWSARTDPGRPVYRLYAVSNVGAIGALVAYPFLIEPRLSVRAQLAAWSAGLALVGVLSLALALRLALRATDNASAQARVPSAPVRLGRFFYWAALAAVGAMALLATTTYLTLDVAVVPFLFLLPLVLYLASFVACFQWERSAARAVWTPVFLVGVAAMAILLRRGSDVALPIQLGVVGTTLLACCMVCHGELVRAKPPPGALTAFYLAVAAGGVAGGAFVALGAPLLFADYWELPLALTSGYVVAGVGLFAAARWRAEAPLARVAPHLWAAGTWIVAYALAAPLYETHRAAIATARSFYGIVRVFEADPGTERWRRYLWHGPICHGSQYLHPSRRREPTMYYTADTGIALAMTRGGRPEGRRIGVVGLGTGTLAAYGRPGDTIRFYELSPDVVRLARRFFTYLEDSPARVEIAVGDGRILLERELDAGGGGFDVLVLDAFSGDAIPVHLLTREAFAVYRRHLRPGGILAVHVSNLHFDLGPVVRAAAETIGLPAVLVQTNGRPEEEIFATDWVLLTDDGRFLSDPAVAAALTPWLSAPLPEPWSDDYANLLAVLADGGPFATGP